MGCLKLYLQLVCFCKVQTVWTWLVPTIWVTTQWARKLSGSAAHFSLSHHLCSPLLGFCFQLPGASWQGRGGAGVLLLLATAHCTHSGQSCPPRCQDSRLLGVTHILTWW